MVTRSDCAFDLPWMTEAVRKELMAPSMTGKPHLEAMSEWLRPDPKNARQLSHAISNRLECTVERLLEMGASADQQPYGGSGGVLIPVDRAVSVSPYPWSRSIAEMIFSACKDPFAKRSSKPLLSWAIEEPDAVKFLLSKGADPDECSIEGDAALAYSSGCSDKHVSIIRVRSSFRRLLDAGASANACMASYSDCPAVVCAAQSQRWPLVKLLLLHGASPDLGGERSLRSLVGQQEDCSLGKWLSSLDRASLATTAPCASMLKCSKSRL